MYKGKGEFSERGREPFAATKGGAGGWLVDQGRARMMALIVAATAVAAMAAPPCLSLVTWNILAPAYASPSKFTWASSDALAWERRQQRIVRRLQEIDADVVCLQEVEVALWDAFSEQLSRFGYDGILQDTGSHPIANAVLLRRGLLEPVRCESRSRALIVVARASSGAPPLYIGNVHLEAGAEKGATRYAQLRSLLRRIELQRAIDAAAEQGRPRSLSPSTDAAGASVVLAGDFNFDRSAELHTFLARGTPPGARTGRKPAMRKLGSASALLPLQDAYLGRPPPWGPTLRSSYRNGRLLDFVWASSNVDVMRTMPVCDLAGSTQPHQLPSHDHPSDHLPIGALLSWPGAPEGMPSSGRPAWQQLFVENVQRQRSDGRRR